MSNSEKTITTTGPTDGTDALGVREYDIAGLQVVLGVPTYGPVNPITAKCLRVAVMHAGNRGVTWLGDGSPDRMGYGAARNTVVQYAFKNVPYADGIMWIDSDIKPAPDHISRLLDTVNHNKLHFVTGVYFQREGVHNPVFYGWNKDKYAFQPAEQYLPNVLGKIDGCGFGFVFTSMKMLKDIALSAKFEERSGWFPDKRDIGGFGEDLSFCYLAKEAGYDLWVDTGIQPSHEGNVQYITEADFKREQEQWIKDNKKQEKRRWGIES